MVGDFVGLVGWFYLRGGSLHVVNVVRVGQELLRLQHHDWGVGVGLMGFGREFVWNYYIRLLQHGLGWGAY